MLSRQIRALEDELRAQLFVRDKRSTSLTEAGRQLLASAVALRPVEDLPPNEVCLAWVAARRSPLVFSFAEILLSV
ncbi:LysR family transcriptional regulator [Amycolatopsis sp. NPDC051106]|uniref:LysR family transcriptional regulator n=1 Tax=unclassified Amycolatopsis TaxID=2618356 RepID=UPI003427A19B